MPSVSDNYFQTFKSKSESMMYFCVIFLQSLSRPEEILFDLRFGSLNPTLASPSLCFSQDCLTNPSRFWVFYWGLLSFSFDFLLWFFFSEWFYCIVWQMMYSIVQMKSLWLIDQVFRSYLMPALLSFYFNTVRYRLIKGFTGTMWCAFPIMF